MSEHAVYALDLNIGTGWQDETIDEPSETDARVAGSPALTPAGNIVSTDDTSNDERVVGWEFSEEGFGGKLGYGNYELLNSSMLSVDIHPTRPYALLAGSGNGSDALKVVVFSELSGFGAEVDSTLDGANGDEVNGAIFHPGGAHAFHWGVLTAVGLHDFDEGAGTLSGFTSLSGTYGATQRGAMWHPNGTYLAVWNDSSPYQWVHPFDESTGSFGTQVTNPSFTGGTFRGGAWSPDGTRLAASFGSETLIFDFDEDLATLTLAMTINSASYNLAWVNDDTLIRKDASTVSSTFTLLTLGATSVENTQTSSTTFTSLATGAIWRFIVSNGWIVFPVTTSPYIRALQVDGIFVAATSDVLQSGGILVSCTRGRSSMRSYGEPDAGDCTFLLDNDGGEYDDISGRYVRLSATYAAATYYLWFGVVDESRHYSDGLHKRVAVRALGRLVELDREIVTDLYYSTSAAPLFVDDMVGYILDAAAWPSSKRSIEVSDTFVRQFWASGQTALSLLQQLATADGVGATFYVDGEGNFVWRSDASRWTDTRSTTSRATFETSPTSDPSMWAPEFLPRRDVVVNSAAVEVGQLVQPSNLDASVVWQADGFFTVLPSAPLTITCVLDAPASAIIVPVETTDYTVTYGNITSVTIDRTSGSIIKLTFTSDTYSIINQVQLRGDGWIELGATNPTSSVPAHTSIYRWKSRPWDPSHVPWRYITTGKGQDLVDSVVTRYKDGVAAFNLGFAGNHTTTAMTRALDFELTDRVTVNETIIGQSGDYYIERITHEIRAANAHFVRLDLEGAVDTDPNQTIYQDAENTGVPLAGSQPTASGTIGALGVVLLAGAQPASTGTVAAQQTLAIALAGTEPAPSGSVSAV